MTDKKRGLIGHEVLIMVASSSKKMEVPESDQFDHRAPDLKGVSADIYNFKDYTKHHPKDKWILIHTSKNNELLSKKVIMDKIK